MREVSSEAKVRNAEIAAAVGKLTEQKLRAELLPALLNKLGYQDVRVLHGPREQGKDLLAWRRTELETDEWVGFVVMTTPTSETKEQP